MITVISVLGIRAFLRYEHKSVSIRSTSPTTAVLAILQILTEIV